MLAGADKVQVLALNLVHHGVHVGLGHDALHNIPVNHKGRDAVGKALVDHKVPGVGNHRGLEPGNVAHEIVEAVAAGLAGAVQVDAPKALHNLGVVGHLEVGHHRLAKALHFHVFAVVLANGHGVVDEVGDNQHPLADFGGHLRLLALHLLQLAGDGLHLLFHLLGLVLLALAHQLANLLADGVALLAQLVAPALRGAELGVQLQNLVHQGQLLVLEFLLDVLLYQLRVGADKLDV